MRVLLLAVLPLLLSSCVGYQLGGNKPAALAGVSSLHVAMVTNDTQIPRGSAHATNAIADAILQDGTYRLEKADHADALLQAILRTIDYRQVTSKRGDSQSSEELEMRVIYDWSVVEALNPLNVLQRGRSSGTTTFFVDPNLQTAQQTALPDALKRAADSMVARIADSF
jgi:hypothetical protein